jgi:hypothetical protein
LAGYAGGSHDRHFATGKEIDAPNIIVVPSVVDEAANSGS